MTTCSSVTHWLPLYVGGDLDRDKMDRVAAHLAGCTGCARTALALEEARVWLRSAEAPEFDNETLLQLRRSVRRELDNRRQEIDRWAWLRICLRPPALAAAAALLAAALAFFLWSRKPGELAKHEVTPAVVNVEKHSDVESGKDIASINTQVHRLTHRLPRRVAQARPAELPAAERQIAEAPVDSPMVRLEIQTADPNIRIIWLTPADVEEFK